MPPQLSTYYTCLLVLLLAAGVLSRCSRQEHHSHEDGGHQDGAGRVTYQGYVLFNVTPTTETQVDSLVQWADKSREQVQFWTYPNAIEQPVQVLTSPMEKEVFESFLIDNKIPGKIINRDVGRLFESELKMLDEDIELSDETLRATNYYQRYQSYPTMEAKVKQLGALKGVSVEQLGRSSENRLLHLIKVSSDPRAKRQVILMDAGHHAREWISHSTLMYIAETFAQTVGDLLTTKRSRREMPLALFEGDNDQDDFPLATGNETTDPYAAMVDINHSDNDNSSAYDDYVPLAAGITTENLKALLKKYDFWFIPVVNPDGYEYSRLRDRFWRKTRSRSGGRCAGVDMNRNYGYKWAVSGSSANKCSDTYHGERAHSEPEVQAITSLMLRNRNRIKMYITLHAFGQLILSPWGYTAKEFPPTYAELMRVGQAGQYGMSKFRGTTFRVGAAGTTIYEASGSADDYAYGTAGIKYSYTVELPPRYGTNRGFVLAPEQIAPVGRETLEAFCRMAEAVR